MDENIRLFSRPLPSGGCPEARRRFGTAAAEAAAAYHESFPEYSPTPLCELKNLAALLGVASFSVKDESGRFGLGAFKVLGGSYCIGRCVAREAGIPAEGLTLAAVTSPAVMKSFGRRVFVTATDGNHGRGVAWTARRLGQRSVVYMPKGSSAERLENIRALGAEASVTGVNYDGTVRLAAAAARENGWTLVQDTSWDGYEEMPELIMQGYTTMFLEIARSLGCPPTHIFLQAGVGAMAGAAASFFADWYGASLPAITIVEPNAADCVFRTAEAGGRLCTSPGGAGTIMAGLDCGTPCGVAWRALGAYAPHFASVPDRIAAAGMRMLGNPLPGDPAIISGESGAAAAGFAAKAARDKALRRALGIDGGSRILCISTEGATDLQSYRRIVWDGAYPSL